MKKITAWLVPHLSLLYEVTSIIVTSVLILLMFPNSNSGSHYTYNTGGIWLNDDLVANIDFQVLKTQTEIAKDEALAKSNSMLYYTVDSLAYATARDRVDSCLLPRNERQQVKTLVDRIYRKGYMEVPPDYQSNIASRTIVILNGSIGEEHKTIDYYDREDLGALVEGVFENAERADYVEHLLADSILQHSICFDAARTQLELNSRLAQTSSGSEVIHAGTTIVRKGEYITPETSQTILSLEQAQAEHFDSNQHSGSRFLGKLLLTLFAFVALFLFLKNTRHSILSNSRHISFVLLMVLFMSAITALVVRINPDWVLLVPLCIAPVLMRVFFDMRVALYIHLTTVIILGSLVPANNYEFIFYQLITGMMSIIAIRNLERRRNYFAIALVIFVTYSLIYTAGSFSQDATLSSLKGERYLVFFVNAVLTLLSYPLIYLFENIFGITTDLTLLELSGSNTPALRELSSKAPGTFQHCTQVANISEDLINEIGGNALLTRVGALYHDIGKIKAPLFFTENQTGDFNPHDELDYEESARVITEHVRDGVALAKKYRLPGVVTDFIRTHHGTTRTGYFYHRWMQDHPGEKCDVSAFKYAGPKPFSRETAVVMIVDSVEAACKSLKNPDQESIGALVDNIIDGKIAEDQLSNCDLTMNDISQIRDFLKKKMMSVYHIRISYNISK